MSWYGSGMVHDVYEWIKQVTVVIMVGMMIGGGMVVIGVGVEVLLAHVVMIFVDDTLCRIEAYFLTPASFDSFI
jgi:hypothetical protein